MTQSSDTADSPKDEAPAPSLAAQASELGGTVFVALALAISFIGLRASIAIGARTRADDVPIASEVRKGAITNHTRRFKRPAGEDIREQDQHAHRGHDLSARRAK